MKKIGIVAFLCLAAASMMVAGCGGGSKGCDFKIGTTHVCEVIAEGDDTGWEDACTAAQGTLGDCAAGLGTCSQKSGAWTVDMTYYSDGGLTADQAKAACEAGGGTWK